MCQNKEWWRSYLPRQKVMKEESTLREGDRGPTYQSEDGVPRHKVKGNQRVQCSHAVHFSSFTGITMTRT